MLLATFGGWLFVPKYTSYVKESPSGSVQFQARSVLMHISVDPSGGKGSHGGFGG